MASATFESEMLESCVCAEGALSKGSCSAACSYCVCLHPERARPTFPAAGARATQRLCEPAGSALYPRHSARAHALRAGRRSQPSPARTALEVCSEPLLSLRPPPLRASLFYQRLRTARASRTLERTIKASHMVGKHACCGMSDLQKTFQRSDSRR
jgi:hypothetical protein